MSDNSIQVPPITGPFTLFQRAVLDDNSEMIAVCPTREIAIAIARALNSTGPSNSCLFFGNEEQAKAFSKRHIEPKER